MAAYLWFGGMFQNIWDARILTGGVSMQKEPMSTQLMSLTPLTPPAHTCYGHCSLCGLVPSLSTLFPLEALLDTATALLTSSGVSSVRGKFQGKSTVTSSVEASLIRPLLLCTNTTFFSCKETTEVKDQLSEKHHQECKVHLHCGSAEVVYP